MQVVIIVQARMTSTRLPGKVMKVVRDKPLLSFLIERLKRVELADRLVVATTTNADDQPIIDFCEQNRVLYFRGDELDVLKRFYEAAHAFSADVIVRVTGDCPLMDPEVVDHAIRYYLDRYPEYSYVSNTHKRTLPRGMDVEVFSLDLLEQAHRNATEKADREHVTRYMYKEPGQFSLGDLPSKKVLSHYRWTVDTKEDFEFVREVITSLYPEKEKFSMEDVLNLLSKRPEIRKINENVQQKNV